MNSENKMETFGLSKGNILVQFETVIFCLNFTTGYKNKVMFFLRNIS